MSAILDIILVLIIGLSIFFAARNGFIKTLLNFSSVIVAIIVVALFSSGFEAKLLESSAAKSVRNAIDTRLAEIVSSKTDDYDPNEVKEQNKFSELLEIVGIDGEEFTRDWESWTDLRTDELRDKLVNYVADPLMKGIAALISFVVLFFGTIIALKIITFVLDKIFALPVLHAANTLLGGVLGVFLAWLRASTFVYIVNLLLPYLQAKDITLLAKIDPAKTVVFQWFENIDIISKLFG